MRAWKWYSKLALTLVVAAFAWFVWPTQWLYHGETVGNNRMLVRQHRVTGRVEVLGTSGWEDLRAANDRFIRAQSRAQHPVDEDLLAEADRIAKENRRD